MSADLRQKAQALVAHLDSLDGWADHVGRVGNPAAGDAIRSHVAALRAALSEPETQEPVAWAVLFDDREEETSLCFTEEEARRVAANNDWAIGIRVVPLG